MRGTPLPPQGYLVGGGFFISRFCVGLCFLRLLDLGLQCYYCVIYGKLMKLCYQLIWLVFLKRNPFQSEVYIYFFSSSKGLRCLLRLYGHLSALRWRFLCGIREFPVRALR